MSLQPADVADAYVEFCLGRGDRFVDLVAVDSYDHVSGSHGVEVWRLVERWLSVSFAERSIELHGVGVTPDGRVMVWMTMQATHIGSAFPWMQGRRATGRAISSAQVHVFRVDGDMIVEHWAVRDDLRVLEAIDHAD